MAVSLANFGLKVCGTCIGGLVTDLEIKSSTAKDNYDTDIICEYEEDGFRLG